MDQQQQALQALVEAGGKQRKKSRGILLILDGIWEPEHEKALNFVLRGRMAPASSQRAPLG